MDVGSSKFQKYEVLFGGVDMLSVEWYGQACFKFEDSRTVITDPHDGKSVGLNPPPSAVADVVMISHDHHDHASGRELVAKEGSMVFTDSGRNDRQGFKITGVDSFHDRSQGSDRGDNVIFTFELDGVRICHLGDLGHSLGNDHLEQIGSVDLLLVPVGGNFTIDGTEAATQVSRMKPQVVIPMHFQVEGLEVPLAGPEDFLQDIEDSYRVRKTETLELHELPREREVVELNCLAS